MQWRRFFMGKKIMANPINRRRFHKTAEMEFIDLRSEKKLQE